MSEYVCLLITMWNGDDLTRVALKVKRDNLSQEALAYYREPEQQAELKALLPMHCRTGPIVEMIEIFEVEVAKGG